MDMEKVKTGIFEMLQRDTWKDIDKERHRFQPVLNDALALLKDHDSVKPHYNARTNWYECGNCHYSMTSGMHCRCELIPATKVRYCANCGFPVNWEGR